MKLTIKTLQNSTFVVTIEPDKTVKELKETIEKEQGKNYPSASQKLIYNGKILGDENKLTEYDFDEKKFVVLMITRPPPPPKPAPAHEQSTSTLKHKSDDKPKPPVATPVATATRQQQASSSSSSSSSSSAAASSSNLGPATPAVMSNTAPQQTVSTARRTNPGDATAMSDTQSRLSSLFSHQQFRQMQDLIQQSPHLLSSTIESLAVEDPEMYNFISENPDAFVNALNYPPMPDARLGQQTAGSGQRHSSQSRPGVGQQPSTLPPVADQLLGNVSEHDKEAIERLKELGFSEYLAVQAYMACDKDEQLAANLLFQMDQ